MTDVRVTREPLTYEKDSPHSFFLDVAKAAIQDERAMRRIDRHKLEMRTNLNTSTGTGAELSPPAYLIEDFATSAKTGRHFAELIGSNPIPRAAQNIYIPRFISTSTQGQSTAIQPAQGAPVTDSADTTANNSSPVATIAGSITATQQVFDQAGAPGFDVMAFKELNKDYNAALEYQLINGTGSNGQLTGLANFTFASSPSQADVSGSGITTLTALWPLLGQAAAAVGNNRGHRVEFWVMAPRRWAWIASSLDNSNRPITSPTRWEGPVDEQGPSPHACGQIFGAPVITSGAITAGATADSVYCGRHADMYLFESDPMVVTQTDVLDGTLQVRIMYHRYAAFIGNLYSTAYGRVKSLPQPSNF